MSSLVADEAADVLMPIVDSPQTTRHVGFNAPASIPRSSLPLPDLDVEETASALAELTIEADPTDITALGKLLLGKVGAVEGAIGTAGAGVGKIGQKLSRTMTFLNAENMPENQQLILLLNRRLAILAESVKNVQGMCFDYSIQLQFMLTLGDVDAIIELRDRLQLGVKEPAATHPSHVSKRASTLSISGEEGGQVEQVKATPKLFAKLPQAVAESGLEKPEMMRLSAVYELIETEIDYVKDLQTMITVCQLLT